MTDTWCSEKRTRKTSLDEDFPVLNIKSSQYSSKKKMGRKFVYSPVVNFKVMGLVIWPLSGSEASLELAVAPAIRKRTQSFDFS